MKEEDLSDPAVRRRNLFDHRSPIKTTELLSLDFKFYMPKMEEILEEAFHGIKLICPSSIHLLWFWHIKNAENDKKWDELDEGKDSYDR